MLWGCGGHGICLTPGDDRGLLDQRSIAWLDKYLNGTDIDTGPTIDLLDQEGVRWVGDEYPGETVRDQPFTPDHRRISDGYRAGYGVYGSYTAP